MCRSSASKCQTPASSSKTCLAVAFVPQAGGDALGPAGGARRVVHRAGQRVRGEIGRGCPRSMRSWSSGCGEDADRGAGVGGQVVPLGRGEGGVEHDRDEADAGRPHGRTYEVGRGAQGEGDPVAPGATPGQQGAGGPALAVLGVGRMQDLDGGGVPGHRGRLRPAARTIAASWGRLSYDPDDVDDIGRARALLEQAAAGGRADRRRDLDGLGHRRLPGAAGRVDQEPRGREDGDAAGLRVGPRVAGAVVAEPADVTDVVGRAERRAPGAGRPRAQRPARPPRHAEHRRAAPEGGVRSCTHRRDPRHVAGGDVPQLRRPSAGRAGARPGPGRRGPTRVAVLDIGDGAPSAAGSSSRPPSASARASSPRTCSGPSRPRPAATCCWRWARRWPCSRPPAWCRSPCSTGRWPSS